MLTIREIKMIPGASCEQLQPTQSTLQGTKGKIHHSCQFGLGPAPCTGVAGNFSDSPGAEGFNATGKEVFPCSAWKGNKAPQTKKGPQRGQGEAASRKRLWGAWGNCDYEAPWMH